MSKAVDATLKRSFQGGLKPKMNAGGKAIKRWDVLQERCSPQDRGVWQEEFKSSGVIFHCFLSL